MITRYVIKDNDKYIETHSTKRKIKWSKDIYQAKVFGRYRHALRWFVEQPKESWEIWTVDITPLRDYIKPIERVTWIIPEEEKELLNINGIWNFIPGKDISSFNNRYGYKVKQCERQRLSDSELTN